MRWHVSSPKPGGELCSSPEQACIVCQLLDENLTRSILCAGVSTSAGIRDYRGPTGAWTQRRIKELQSVPSPAAWEKEVSSADS